MTNYYRTCIASLLFIFFAPGVTSAHTVPTIADSFHYPVSPWNPLTRDFNVNVPNATTNDRYHTGEDVERSAWTEIRAAARGIVKHNSWITGYGYVVIVEHTLPSDEVVCTIYGHLAQFGVAQFGHVEAGAFIGYAADVAADYGTGPHSHFGIRKGAYTTASDLDGFSFRYRGYAPQSVIPQFYDPTTFFALQDMDKRAKSDSRFGKQVPSSFGSIPNWDSNWDLSYVAYSLFGSSTVADMFQITYKNDHDIRYTIYADPYSGAWKDWQQAL